MRRTRPWRPITASPAASALVAAGAAPATAAAPAATGRAVTVTLVTGDVVDARVAAGTWQAAATKAGAAGVLAAVPGAQGRFQVAGSPGVPRATVTWDDSPALEAGAAASATGAATVSWSGTASAVSPASTTSPPPRRTPSAPARSGCATRICLGRRGRPPRYRLHLGGRHHAAPARAAGAHRVLHPVRLQRPGVDDADAPRPGPVRQHRLRRPARLRPGSSTAGWPQLSTAGVFTLPQAMTELTFDQNWQRPATAADRVGLAYDTVWTFRSGARTQGAQRLLVPQVDVPSGLRNARPAGQPTAIGPGAVADARAGAFVHLRVTPADGQGSAVTRTTVRAYEVR